MECWSFSYYSALGNERSATPKFTPPAPRTRRGTARLAEREHCTSWWLPDEVRAAGADTAQRMELRGLSKFDADLMSLDSWGTGAAFKMKRSIRVERKYGMRATNDRVESSRQLQTRKSSISSLLCFVWENLNARESADAHIKFIWQRRRGINNWIRRKEKDIFAGNLLQNSSSK